MATPAKTPNKRMRVDELTPRVQCRHMHVEEEDLEWLTPTLESDSMHLKVADIAWEEATSEARKAVKRKLDVEPTSDDDVEHRGWRYDDVKKSACADDIEEDAAIKIVLETLNALRGPSREAAIMKLADKIKVELFGVDFNTKDLLIASVAAKATTEVHEVIRDEVIRLGVGRKQYRAVVIPLFNRIRGAIGWKDCKGVKFCPKWAAMKDMVSSHRKTGPNKGLNIKTPDWVNGGDGCVWTQVDIFLAERLIKYRKDLPATYRSHLKTIATRVEMVEEMCPGLFDI